MSKKSISNKILYFLLAIGAVLFVTHLVLQYLNIVVHYQQVGGIYELSNRFDFDDESSVPTWFSQALFLSLALTAFLAAYLQTQKSKKFAWSVVSLVALVFSIDEVAALHEFALQLIHVQFFQDSSATGSDNAWLLVAPFLIAGFVWLLWVMLRSLPKRTVILFMVGGIMILAGAIFLDLAAVVGERESFITQGLIVSAEEILEILGGIILVYATIDYLERYHKKAITKSFKALKDGRLQE
jgi:hypothetical protein